MTYLRYFNQDMGLYIHVIVAFGTILIGYKMHQIMFRPQAVMLCLQLSLFLIDFLCVSGPYIMM